MPAVTLLDKDRIDPELKGVFGEAEEHFGRVPNLVKALATNPEMCRSITEFLIQALGPGRLDWGLKELLILKTLRSNRSYYGFGAHERLAVELGVPEGKIGDLANSLWRETHSSPRGSGRSWSSSSKWRGTPTTWATSCGNGSEATSTTGSFSRPTP